MRGVNKAIVLGHLGNDPELISLPNGTPVCRVSLATNEKWTDKTSGEVQERTEWHRAVLFAKAAEIVAEFLSKGDSLYIEGKLATRKWQDEKGIDRYTTEIMVREFQFIGSKGGGESAPQSTPAQNNAPDDQDIPF